MKIRLLLVALASLLLVPAGAQKKSRGVLDLKYSIEDSGIIYPESFEKGSQKLLERWYLKNYTSSDSDASAKTDPGATDEEIKRRLAALPTVIDMPFNPIVKSYIERFTKKGRPQVTALLGLGSYYLPIFEQQLEASGLPLELKYLPVIESGLDPTATSKHGAAGLWQFIIGTARGYDMEVSSLVDERRDPYLSTEKACRLLHDLYDAYGDWSLAIAAYNCGPGNVNKALNRAGGTPETLDFWDIYYYLPAETRGYVPMFIAANYVMNYYPEHDIAPVLITKPLITDTLHLTERVHFNQISAILDIPVEELRVLNPQFRADVIPASAERPYTLILPSQQIHAYIVSEDQILAYDRDKYARKTEAVPGGDPDYVADEPADATEVAVQVSGPIDGAVAEIAYEEAAAAEADREAAVPRHRRRDTSLKKDEVKEIAETAPKAPKKTDNAETNAKAPKASKADAAASKAKKETTASTSKSNTKSQAASKKPTSHTVESGQNLSVIAKKYGVSVEQLKKANPGKSDMIHPGDKINIPSTKSAKNSSKSSGSKKKKR